LLDNIVRDVTKNNRAYSDNTKSNTTNEEKYEWE